MTSGSCEVDLDAYCARIGYAGPREPTLAVLKILQRLHPAAIPFEAIDVLLGRGVSLEPTDIDAKLIGARRGGYCFEQNDLFKRALRAMGFDVLNLLARPRWNRPLDQAVPRTHQAVRIRLDGEEWMADVGFGVAMLTAPIRIDERGPQATAFEPVRLRPVDDELRLEVFIGETWAPIYDLLPHTPLDIDYMAPNWYTSTHPHSIFRRGLIITRTAADVRYSLADNLFTRRPREGEVERRRLGVEELKRTLSDGFDLPVQPDWLPVLERAVEAGGM